MNSAVVRVTTAILCLATSTLGQSRSCTSNQDCFAVYQDGYNLPKMCKQGYCCESPNSQEDSCSRCGWSPGSGAKWENQCSRCAEGYSIILGSGNTETKCTACQEGKTAKPTSSFCSYTRAGYTCEENDKCLSEKCLGGTCCDSEDKANCKECGGSGKCTKCASGYTLNGAACAATECAANQYVSSNECVNCAPGTTRAAGDLATGDDTACAAIECAANQYVSSNVCVNCAPGSTRNAGDLATGDDTTCAATTCAANQYVSSNVCVNCAPGSTRNVGDLATGIDTECSSSDDTSSDSTPSGSTATESQTTTPASASGASTVYVGMLGAAVAAANAAILGA